jgi:hypothetical protein
MLHRVVLVSLLLLDGCCSCGPIFAPTDTPWPPDVTPAPDAPDLDTPASDAPDLDAPASDASDLDARLDGPDTGASCLTRTLETMPISELLLAEALDVHAGRSFRVAARYTQPDSCHARAMTKVEIDPVGRIVDMTVRDWVTPGGGCLLATTDDTRFVTLQLESGDWTIRDASPGGTARLAITIGPGIRAPCVPDGGACQQNCDCLGAEVCLSARGVGGDPFTACAEPCEADLDCMDSGGRCTSLEDGFDLICRTTAAGCGPAGCPAGYACEPSGRCAPTFVLGAASRVPCACDADCAPGLACVTGTGIARCEVPCPTAGSWCSGSHACGEARQDVSGLAASDAVCGSVGE